MKNTGIQATTRNLATIGAAAAVDVYTASASRSSCFITNTSAVTYYWACGRAATTSDHPLLPGESLNLRYLAPSRVSVIAASGATLTLAATP